jgi:hypothetical protein
LAPPTKFGRQKRVMPRISEATGGLMPGIDLIDLSSLQDVEDLDYLRRSMRPT